MVVYTDTNAFLETLPKGPLIHHIGQVHAILIHTGAYRDGPYAMELAQHSLREMAVYTADYDRQRYVPPAPLRIPPMPKFDPAQMRDALLTATRGVTDALARMRRNDTAGEGRKKLRYANRIESERQQGLQYVHDYATQIRKELGL